MAKTFATLKTNVATEVRDTSDVMKAIIGTYLNNRYKQVLRTINFNAYNEDYQITLVGGTQDYTLESDFGKELYAFDKVNNRNFERIDFGAYVTTNPSLVGQQGTPLKYSVFTSDDGNKKARFYQIPNAGLVVDFPYLIYPAALSVDGDTPILDLDDIIERGAVADAWRYKRQFAKARDHELLFAAAISRAAFEQDNQPNMEHMAQPVAYSRETV